MNSEAGQLTSPILSSLCLDTAVNTDNDAMTQTTDDDADNGLRCNNGDDNNAAADVDTLMQTTR